MAELEKLKDRLAVVNNKMSALSASDAYLDEVGKHFHLGMVGGSGNKRSLARLNARREHSLDRSIDRAKEYNELAQERDNLQDRIAYIESGRKERVEEARRQLDEKLRVATTGTTVIDSAYGEVSIVRVNRKTITIECHSGYREARPFSLIVGIR